LCCDHGIGNVTLFLNDNMESLPGGGNFSSGRHFVTELGSSCSPQPPTFAPIPTEIPTSSNETCDDGYLPVRVELTTDRHPDETRWHVEEKHNDTSQPTQLVSGGPYTSYTDAHQTFLSEEVCVKNTSCLSFVIIDTGEDGLCCKSGRGGYSVWYDDSVVAYGEAWKGFSHDVPFGSCDPSTTDSSSFVPLQCETGTSALRVEVSTGFFPEEVTWAVVDSSNETMLQGGPYEEEFERNAEETCVPNDACFAFQIQDAGGDGISCEEGKECYKVFLGAELQASGARFGAEENHNFCSTMSQSPSVSFFPSTTEPQPTKSPVSVSPSTTNYPSVPQPPSISQHPSSAGDPSHLRLSEDPLSKGPPL